MATGVALRAGEQIVEVRLSGRALPQGTGTISGVVLTDSGAPAAGATLSIRTPEYWSHNHARRASEPREVIADAAGRFRFADVPDEAVSLSARAPGFPDIEYGQIRPGLAGTPVRVAPGGHFVASMRFRRGGVISGTIYEVDGRPAAGAHVFASRLEPMSDTSKVMGAGGQAITGADGQYEIQNLPAGEYLANTIRRLDPPVIQPLPLVPLGDGLVGVETGGLFFRDAQDGSSAEIIALAPGATRTGIDMRLRVVPVTTVTGRVRLPDGRPASNAVVQLFTDYLPDVPVASARTNGEGEFEMTRVAAGSYAIGAFQDGPDPLRGHTPFASDGRTPGQAEVNLRPGATVTGRIVLAGNLPYRDTSQQFTLFFSAIDGGMGMDVRGLTREIDGRHFTYRGVPPGRYVIFVNRETIPEGWRMESEMVDGRDALDFPFEIGGGERRDVLITLSDRVSSLSGTVVSTAGVAAPGCTVIVFAAEERYWGAWSRRMEAIRPDTSGRFRFVGLPAGQYIVAVAGADVFGRPPTRLLRTLRATGTRVTLAAGEQRVQDLQFVAR